MGSIQRGGRDLLIGALAIGLVISATYLVGRVSLPPSSAPPDITQASPMTSRALDPAAEVAARPEVLAVIDASGAVEGRLLLDRAVPNAQIHSGPDGSSDDIDIKYEGAGATLRLLAPAITVGVARTDRMTLLVTYEGKTFNAHPGDCVLMVSRFEYLHSAGFSRLTASFVAELTCTEIADIRSGDTLSFTAVIDS